VAVGFIAEVQSGTAKRDVFVSSYLRRESSFPFLFLFL